MAVRQIVQFIVLPKSFDCVDFYQKGLYHLQFSIFNEDQFNNRKYGCPFILHSRTAILTEQKKARVDMQKSIYTTQQQLSVFRLNTVNSKYTQELNVYLPWNMNSTKSIKPCFKQVSKNLANSKNYHNRIKSQLLWKNKSKYKKVLAKYRPYLPLKYLLNKISRQLKHHFTLNSFKRVYFTEPMFFSCLDFHISCFHHGFLIRKHQYHRSDFWSLQNEKKQQLFVQDKVFVPNQYKMGKKIRKIFAVEVEAFYRCTLQKAIKQYQRVVNMYKQYFKQISSGNPRYSVTQHKFPDLGYVLVAQSQRQTYKLLKHYGTTLQNELFFYILNESYQVIKNVKYCTQLLAQLLLTMTQNTFNNRINQQMTKQKTKRFSKLVKNDYLPLQKMKHIKKSYVVKRQNYIRSCSLVEDRDLHHPLLVLQNYDWQSFSLHSNFKQIGSLVILIHGFHGSPSDMEKLKNYIQTINQTANFFIPKSLSLDVNGTIYSLGQKVAEQIKKFIDQSACMYSKISFIGFSLGGVVARSAMHHLKQYKKNFNLLITLGSPHLGVSNNQNSLVKAGVWYMRKFQNAINLDQLAMIQNQVEDCILYQLANSQSLAWPRKVIVVSCKQDHFVPQYSAKIQQTHQNRHISQLSSKIRSKIKRLQRVSVWFDVQHLTTSFEKLIGRRSHVELLDNDRFLETLMQLYGHQF